MTPVDGDSRSRCLCPGVRAVQTVGTPADFKAAVGRVAVRHGPGRRSLRKGLRRDVGYGRGMARKKAPTGRWERLEALFGSRIGRVLVRVTLASLVFLLAGIVMRQARAYTYRMDEFRVQAKNLRMVDLPPWADRNVQWALQPKWFEPLSVSIYDPDAEAVVRARVCRHPMIRGVEDVRVLYPHSVRLRPVLRVPVAKVAVWVDDDSRGQVRRWRLLSDDGCLLPRSPYRAYLERRPPLPAVTGITEPMPLRAGEVWEDRQDRVKEAVAAARLSARLHRDFQGQISVLRIDVSRFTPDGARRKDGEVRLTLSCPPVRRGGKRVARLVEWGRTERARRDVLREDTYEVKSSRLRNVLTQARPPREIDVRWQLSVRGRTAP